MTRGDEPRRRGFAGAELWHPAPLLATALLLVNDHLLKGSAVAGAVTGKLSDVSGLFVLPITLAALGHAVLRGRAGARGVSRGIDAAACAVAAVGFAALKLSPTFNAWLGQWWGDNLLDPSDLVALPAVAFAYLYLREHHGDRPRGRGSEPRFASAVCLAGAAVACMATPAQPPPPPRPIAAWQLTGADHVELGCAAATARVARSGKTGVGMVVALANQRSFAPCPVALDGAALALPGAQPIAATVVLRVPAAGGAAEPLATPAHLDLAIGETAYLYLGFEFDNQQRWNRGERRGAFRVVLSSERRTTRWTLPAEHRYLQLPAPGWNDRQATWPTGAAR